MAQKRVYLDYQSATPVLPAVQEAMLPFFRSHWANPSSIHALGKSVRDAIEQARVQTARLVRARSPEEILFTSSGTEAANLAVKGVAIANRRYGQHLILSSIEHPSVLNSAGFLERLGFSVTRLRVNHEGLVDLNQLADAIRDDTLLIAVQWANSEVGAIQNLEAVGKLCHQNGIPLYCDAGAAAGWQDIDVEAMGVHLLSFAPDRFYGPKGVGVLYCRSKTRLEPVLHGGDQERGLRAGTENVPAIVGCGVAAQAAVAGIRDRRARVARLQVLLYKSLKESLHPITLNGPPLGPQRMVTNLNLSIEATDGEGQVLLADMRGLSIHSGSVCSSRSIEQNYVLKTMGLSPDRVGSSILLSLSDRTTPEEVACARDILRGTTERLRSLSPAWER